VFANTGDLNITSTTGRGINVSSPDSNVIVDLRDNDALDAAMVINADQEGTPQQVQKVVDTLRANKIPVVFSESTISDKAMLQVAKETGARYGGVLYVDSLTAEDGPAPTYLKLLQYNADTIVKAFTQP
jgi:ABC-type Zn uptake system ZnuABC Zn-binding protein ZnuA